MLCHVLLEARNLDGEIDRGCSGMDRGTDGVDPVDVLGIVVMTVEELAEWIFLCVSLVVSMLAVWITTW